MQRLQLLRLLAAGGFQEVAALCSELAVAPADLEILLEQLRRDGFELHRREGSQYALAAPIEWLDESRIRAVLPAETAHGIAAITVLDCVDSTNHWLAEAPPPSPGQSRVCLAEAQSGGRGRLGRDWISPPAANLYLSLIWRFGTGVEAAAGLSLAIGVATAEACEALGARDIGLKWPNDLIGDGAKFGGILIELRGECAIIGIGINVNLAAGRARRIDQAVTDLQSLTRGPVSRNLLAGEVLNAVHGVLVDYAHGGLAPYRERWCRRDVLRRRQVAISDNGQALSGTALGIDASGAYLLETTGGETVALTAGSLQRTDGPRNPNRAP